MEATRLSHRLWNTIQQLVAESTPGSEVVYGQVIDRDEDKMLVWLEDFGDQPIPIVGFRYTVNVYDESPRGTTVPAQGQSSPYQTYKKQFKVKTECPKIGDTVVVLRQMGSRRLAKCVGIVLSKGFVVE